MSEPIEVGMQDTHPSRSRRGRGKNYWMFQDDKGRWWLDYRTPDGRRKRKLCGTYETAKTERAAIETAKKRGTYIDENSAPYLSEYSDRYLETVSTHKESYECEKRLMKSLVSHFGKFRLTKITRSRVRDFRNERIKNVKPATVNREIALLRHMFNVAIDDGLVSVNPARGGPGLKSFKEIPRTRFLEKLAITKLLAGIDARIKKNEKNGSAKKYWQYLRTAVIVAVHCGMRKGEILSLKWSQVNWEKRNIILEKTKNGMTRRVPMDTILSHELAQHRSRVKNEEFVFPSFDSNGNVVALKDVKVAFGQVLKDTEISDFHFHDLRHTFASHYMMTGGNLYTLSKILGHKDIKMTQRYADLSPDYIDRERERMDSIWTSAIETTEEQPRENIPIL